MAAAEEEFMPAETWSGSGALLLNTNSVIMCPHGGMVVHVPVTSTTFRVDGRRPMLMTDIYNVVGCPFVNGYHPSPCQSVTWVSASSLLLVKGIPVLTRNSVGICGFQGPAIITYTQTGQREPSEFTNVNA